MSNLAYAPLPQQTRREEPQRRVEIVSTRAQRRARPRPLYALVAIGGLFALFMAQLLMSIVISNGAYQISSLQSQQSDLGRQQQSLGEQVDTLASTQNLAVKASALGMVQSTALPAFLDVTTGKVTGTSHSAKDAASGTTAKSINLVPNSLLADATPTDGTMPATADTTAGTTTAGTTTAATTDATTPVDPTDPPVTAATEDATASAVTDSTTGAPALASNTAQVASQSGLPIPVTR